MIDSKDFVNFLEEKEVQFFSGVPDSLLSNVCFYLIDHFDTNKHMIAANEGAAVALGIGYHLATGNIPLCYMQNSGFGNAINPLLSLADQSVYSIPMLLLIGWRGNPEEHDEPQHIKQGQVTIPMLKAMGLPYEVLHNNWLHTKMILEKSIKYVRQNQTPYVLLVRRNTFNKYVHLNKKSNTLFLTRETALECVIKSLNPSDVVVSTTGMISREVFEIRKKLVHSHAQDFLTVGGMGHASQVALGIALQKPDRQVYCLDGDGALLMHMGALAINGTLGLKNFKHILINNGAHDSVGGQPTVAFKIDFPRMALAAGYKFAKMIQSEKNVSEQMKNLKNLDGPLFLEIQVKKGSRNDLGRPPNSFLKNKELFVSYLA
ncbi:MAG: phosphonopyruvate decarboxylase [Alphaproteobacteria bacterium]|nr:phosphonopyruvate decarboxylase [Alphaproteobacteria bacterium]